MPNRTKPLEQKKREGTLQKCRMPANVMQCKPTKLPEVPETVLMAGNNSVSIWNETISELDNNNMLYSVDLAMLAMYAMLMGRAMDMSMIISTVKGGEVYSTPNGFHQKRPEVTIMLEYLDRAYKIGQSFGVTPAARAKVSAGEQKKSDDLYFLNEPI